MSRLRKLADLIREPLPAPAWKPPELGARPYPLPPQFERDLSWDPPAVGMVEISRNLVLDRAWMRRHQATLAALYAAQRVVIVEDVPQG